MDTVKITNKNGVKIVAHRGASALERENTCASFLAAGNRTYYGIETDLYRTKDGKYAICHDPSLLRCGGVDLKIEESTLEELRAVALFDIDGKSHRSDLRVPELSDYISICKKYEKVAVLELKSVFTDAEIAEILAIINGFDYLANVTFISFIPENLLKVRAACAETTCQLLPAKNDPEWIFKFCTENRIDLDVYFGALTKEIVDMAHKAGLKVNCWTVDQLADAEKMIEFGVDYITSNRLE